MAPSTIGVHHAVLGRALKKAARDRLILTNPVTDAEQRPRVRASDRTEAARRCWSLDEARKVLEASKRASPQMCAFVHLALDTGARKSELCGLLWSDVDLDAGTVTIARQLDIAGKEPTFGPTKTDRVRVVPLTDETITRLRAHKTAQAELKMKNRTVYQDFGLVFAREHEHLHLTWTRLGQPTKAMAEWSFTKLLKEAGVRRVTFHGVRHTVATLLLQAGVPVHLVSARLGHSQTSQTLNTYAHALPSAQADAVARLGSVLHG